MLKVIIFSADEPLTEGWLRPCSPIDDDSRRSLNLNFNASKSSSLLHCEETKAEGGTEREAKNKTSLLVGK